MINDLTRRLLAEGWTRDHHPDAVYWSDFENFGFKWEEQLKMRWTTGCGLCVDPRDAAMSDTTYQGVWYCTENGNPAIRCPYGRRDCPHNIPGLKFPWCVCHETDAPYDPERSVGKVKRERNACRMSVMELTGGQYCACVVDSNGMDGGVHCVRYNVEQCIQVGCKNTVCSITKKPRDLSKVNVYYDIRRTWITRKGFLEDTKTAIEKGIKVFPRPVARTDAEIWLARKKAEFDPFRDKYIINPHITPLDRKQSYFSKHHRRWPEYDYFEFRYEVENIRIEARETRDLLQDLQDVAEGIEVVHASDALKATKEQEKARKIEAAEQKAKRAEKKLLAVGWDTLDDFERKQIYKALGDGRVHEIRKRMAKPVQTEEQISLSEFLKGDEPDE